MEILENNSWPQRCQECQDVKEWDVDCACYNCDYALDRFTIIDSKEKTIVR